MEKLLSVEEVSVIDVLYEKSIQRIRISGCVLELKTGSFYGPFLIYDHKNRLLGKSENGIISFRRNDLQTEEAKVWYDSISCFSKQYKELALYINEPGLCFNHIPELYIEFLDAPSVEKEPKRVFTYVHIFSTETNFWDAEKKGLKYK